MTSMSAAHMDAGSVRVPGRKPRRMNFACNYCRSRKTRCDEQEPACSACRDARVPCVTTDRRRPGVHVTRRKPGLSGPRPRSIDAGKGFVTSIDQSPGDESTVVSSQIDFPQRSDPDTIVVVEEESGVETSQGQTPQFQGRLPMIQSSSGSTSFEIVASWLDLSLYRLSSQRFRPGVVQEEHGLSELEYLNPLGQSQLPSLSYCLDLAKSFFNGPAVLFPLLDREDCELGFRALVSLGSSRFARSRGIVPLLQLQLVLFLGHHSGKKHQQAGFDARALLNGSLMLLGFVLKENSVEAVEVLLLFAMAQLSNDQMSASWHTTSLAVSLATAIGLQKSRLGPRKQGHKAVLYEKKQKVWISLYAFEKLLAFQMGRPSSIIAEDEPSSKVSSAATTSSETVFLVVHSLATVLSVIGRRCIQNSKKDETSPEGDALNAVVNEKVRTTGESYLALVKWADSVPDGLRPTSDFVSDSTFHPFAAFISMQYYNALILLKRNSLLISSQAIANVADNLAKDQPWSAPIRSGQLIAANAARKVLQITLETADSENRVPLPCLIACLNASVSLTIYLLKNPISRRATTDLQLLEAAIEAMDDTYSAGKGSFSQSALIIELRQMLQNHFQENPGHPPSGDLNQTMKSLYGTAIQLPANQLDDNVNLNAQQQLSAATTLNDTCSGTVNQGFFGNSLDLWDDSPPCLPDGIGWDWSEFSLLFPEHGNTI